MRTAEAIVREYMLKGKSRKYIEALAKTRLQEKRTEEILKLLDDKKFLSSIKEENAEAKN